MSQPHVIRDPSSLDQAFEESDRRPVFLFKHSLTCPVSSAAFEHYRAFVEAEAEPARVAFHLIEIQNSRPVSNAAAERTGVRHESPQVLLLREGEVVWHASHGAIRQDALESALGQFAI